MSVTTAGYVYAYDTILKRDSLQHRLVMEEHIGRYLTSNENVHHKNGDKADNRLENLEIVSRAQHTIDEIAKRKMYPWSMKWESCIICGGIDKPHHAKGRCKNCDALFRYYEGKLS